MSFYFFDNLIDFGGDVDLNTRFFFREDQKLLIS